MCPVLTESPACCTIGAHGEASLTVGDWSPGAAVLVDHLTLKAWDTGWAFLRASEHSFSDSGASPVRESATSTGWTTLTRAFGPVPLPTRWS